MLEHRVAHAPDAHDADAFFGRIVPGVIALDSSGVSPVGVTTAFAPEHSHWQRLRRIGEIVRIDRHAPLDQAADGGDVALHVDAHGVGEMRAVKLEQQHRIRSERTAHARRRRQCLPSHALDVEVVLLRPERRRGVVGGVAAGGVAADDRAVFLRMTPVLEPHRAVGAGKARAVAGREDRGI